MLILTIAVIILIVIVADHPTLDWIAAIVGVSAALIAGCLFIPLFAPILAAIVVIIAIAALLPALDRLDDYITARLRAKGDEIRKKADAVRDNYKL